MIVFKSDFEKLRNLERKHSFMWRSKIYPEGLNNYYEMLQKGLEENRKFREKWTK